MKVAGLDALDIASRVAQARDAKPAQAAGGVDFSEQLTQLLRGADQEQKVAESESAKLALGEGDVVETMVALTKADLSLRTVTEVRNRALEAFQEILRLQI